jgi:hypothetical protein
MDDDSEGLSLQDERLTEVLETLSTEELRQLVAEIEERLGVANGTDSF